MKIIDVEQGTPEWKAARAGRVTASKISELMAKGKGGAESAGRRNYRAQIVAEILTKEPQDRDFRNAAMDWGNEQEPFARAAYEIEKGMEVEKVGFVIHPRDDRAGCSPDGLVGFDGDWPTGLVQIKCPNTATHLDTIKELSIPSEYRLQMFFEMACTGAGWNDFVSFDPRLPKHLQLVILRLHRDDAEIARIEQEIAAFHQEVDQLIASLPPAPTE